MVSLLDIDLERRGELSLVATEFDDGERMPDYVGHANENANPALELAGVPDDAESLVVVMDDPDTRPAVGFTFDHWLVWDVDPDLDRIPRDWDPSSDGATVGYNDLVEPGYAGPAPRGDEHAYRIKLLALDGTLDTPAEARKAVIDMRVRTGSEVLASTQLVGTYDPSQGGL